MRPTRALVDLPPCAIFANSRSAPRVPAPPRLCAIPIVSARARLGETEFFLIGLREHDTLMDVPTRVLRHCPPLNGVTEMKPALLIVCVALCSGYLQREAHAQTVCSSVRVVTEPGQVKFGPPASPWIVSTVPGSSSFGTNNSTVGNTELFIGLDSFGIPAESTITSIRVYGSDQSPLSMTFTFRLAIASSEAQVNVASWASTNGPTSWVSPTLATSYFPTSFTYWLSVFIPDSSTLMNVHTVRACWTE
jgi:hypothetical protein